MKKQKKSKMPRINIIEYRETHDAPFAPASMMTQKTKGVSEKKCAHQLFAIRPKQKRKGLQGVARGCKNLQGVAKNLQGVANFCYIWGR